MPSPKSTARSSAPVGGRRQVQLALSVEHSPDGAARGRLVPLERDLRIGRDRDCDLALRGDPGVSRAHAELRRDGQTLVVVDSGSRGGTYVNGHRVRKAELGDGDVVRVGDTVMLVLEAPSGDPGPLPPVELDPGSGIVGRSAGLRGVVDRLRRCGPTELCVLVTGEPGVGKELVARHLHRLSGRRGPFVPVNCASLRPELACSELFGHARGAFSGADSEHQGLFHEAAEGTLLFDEVAELPASVQAQLLRTIETGEVRPVGASRTFQVRTRVLAATNRDLEQAAAAGEFRRDLLARLAQWQIRVPPLRQRKADILPLLRHFLDRFGGQDRALTPDLVEAVCVYDWPNNVRELMLAARRLTMAARETPALEVEDLPSMVGIAAEPPPAVGAPARPTAEELDALLRRHRGNVTDVARGLGCHRVQVHRWIRRHGLEPQKYRR